MAAIDTDLAPLVLSVFWCGTGSDAEDCDTQIQMFYQSCLALDLSHLDTPITEEAFTSSHGKRGHYKMIFTGCAVAYGTSGMLWGTGLDKQADLLITRIEELQQGHGTERRLVVNLFGLSRGGVACFIFAKKLSKWDPALIDVNILAFDPVPGNFVATAKLDFFGLTNAWSNMDLKKSAVVKTALLLYPYEPLPTLAVHAPMIPKFSRTTQVTYEVILGCHQGAVWNTGTEKRNGPLDVWVSGAIVRNFLTSHGTILEDTINLYFESNDSLLLNYLHEANQSPIKSTRCTHSKGGIEILRTPGQEYLNKFHYILTQLHNSREIHKAWNKRPYFYSLTIPDNPAPSYSLHFSKNI